MNCDDVNPARPTCAECVELIARQLDGLLSESQAGILESHVAACPRCRAELALQVEIARVLALPEPALSWRAGLEQAGLRADFAAAVSRRAFATYRSERRAQWLGYMIPIAASAAVLLLAILYRADIAAAVAPSLSVLGRLVLGAVDSTGQALAGASARAPEGAGQITPLLGIWGSIACAAAVVVLSASRIFTLARR